MVAAESRHLANTRETIGLMRRMRLRSAIRRLNDYGVAVDKVFSVPSDAPITNGCCRQDRRGPRSGRRVDFGLQGLRSSSLISRRLETCSHDAASAAVLKLEIRSDNPLPTVIVAVSDKHLLLLLDNCEHGIDAVHAQNLLAAIVAPAAI
jgi:hypothetical protein